MISGFQDFSIFNVFINTRVNNANADGRIQLTNNLSIVVVVAKCKYNLRQVIFLLQCYLLLIARTRTIVFI